MSDRIFSSCKTNTKINRPWENQAILKILDVFPIDIQRVCLGGNHWYFKCKSRYRDNICQSCRPKLGSPCSHERKLQEKKGRELFYCHIKSAYLALISLSNYVFAYWIHFWRIICIRRQSALVNMLLESGAWDCSPRSVTVWDVTSPFCSFVDSPTTVWSLYTKNLYSFWYNAMRPWSCIGLLGTAAALILQKQGIFKGGIA